VARAWSYSADQATDGVIPAHVLPGLAHGPPPKRVIAELLQVGVWEAVDDGYRCTLYLEANISREEWEAKKAGQRVRTKRHRDNKDEAAVTDEVTRYIEPPGTPVTQPVTRYPQTPGHQDTRTPRSAGSASDARAPDPGGGPPSPDLGEALLDGFGRRWERALEEGPWPRTASPQCIASVLRVVGSREDPLGSIERGLDAYFADALRVGTRPEFGWRLARDFGAWIGASSLPVGSSRKSRLEAAQRVAARTLHEVPSDDS
jgi:hypothetical protein